MNHVASSAVLFRRWSAAQFLRSGAVASSGYSHCSGRELAANRTTSGGVTSPGAPAPWLLLAECSNTGAMIWRFFCCAKNKIYYFLPDEHNRIPKPQILFCIGGYVELVGSSQGWLASYERRKRDLFLSDPINCREINLPPPPPSEGEDEDEEVVNVVLSDPAEGEGEGEGEGKGKAFMIFGSGRSLAFCSPGRSHGWTLFGGGGEYESAVYSTTHRRLLCLTSTLKLEAWDVEGESPRLDWAARLESPAQKQLGPELTTRLKYVACEEQSGEVFVVVRHVKAGAGCLVKAGIREEYVCPTVDFEVWKIDGDEVVGMENCLEGMTIFVGNNHPIAIKDMAGVKPDSVYFTYDKRVRPADGNDVGVFDYKRREMCRHWITDQINGDVDSPVWFTPRHR